MKNDTPTAKDVSFQKWTKEINIPDSYAFYSDNSYISNNHEIEDEDQNIEGLIDELKQEYQLNEIDISQLKSDVGNTVDYTSSHLRKSFLRNNFKGNMSQMVDKGTLKANMMLKLMSKKLEDISNRNKTMDLKPLKGMKTIRAKYLKMQRMNLSIHSRIWALK